jgi:hypothetical protein
MNTMVMIMMAMAFIIIPHLIQQELLNFHIMLGRNIMDVFQEIHAIMQLDLRPTIRHPLVGQVQQCRYRILNV